MTTKLLDDIAGAVIAEIKASLAPRDARLAALEQRLGELEQKPVVKFCGTWTADRSYAAGDATVRQGGLWICRKSTMGDWAHDAWTLAVKRGSVS